ncbi:MAG: response regulator [Candidatus Binatia bacterium]
MPSRVAASPAIPATVVVVDDDPLNRTMLSMSLGAEGHQVREAGNGREAIAVLAAEAIDVVLTDIEMPEMDGYGLLRHCSGDARLKTIPFIVISGVDEMDSIVACIRLGAEDYLETVRSGAAARCWSGTRASASGSRRRCAKWNGSTGCGASSPRSSPRRSPPAASRSSPATGARARCCSATCAASPRSPRRPSRKK